MTLTRWSSVASRTAASNSSGIGGTIVLSRSGRVRVIVAIGPSVLYSSVSKLTLTIPSLVDMSGAVDRAGRIAVFMASTGGPMGDRWFTEEELREMSRPTMDRAIEALDRGDLDAARALCEEMKHEWRYLHDLMVEGI